MHIKLTYVLSIKISLDLAQHFMFVSIEYINIVETNDQIKNRTQNMYKYLFDLSKTNKPN